MLMGCQVRSTVTQEYLNYQHTLQAAVEIRRKKKRMQETLTLMDGGNEEN